tara:strand:+ start:112 stop:402 length:291 start_codon:yes stop_codon:yes gene_type:complete
MKVTIQQRSVYHKYAEVEINIDEDDYEDYQINNKDAHLQDYLEENAHLYGEEIDKKIHEANYEFGFGVDEHNGMDMKDSESEWRYDCEELKTGGHL